MPRRPDSDLGPLARAKTRLRSRMLQRRAERDPLEAEPAGRRVSELVIATPEFAAALRVALYAARADELPSRCCFEAVLSSGREALLPRMEAGQRLSFRRVDRWEALVPGRFGILEPGSSVPATRLEEGDLVLVPGVERRKVLFTHFNHTNPVADPGSEAAARVRAAGAGLAAEGQVFPL